MRERNSNRAVEWQGEVNLVECVGDGSNLINYLRAKQIRFNFLIFPSLFSCSIMVLENVVIRGSSPLFHLLTSKLKSKGQIN